MPSTKELIRLRTLCHNQFPAWCDSSGYVLSHRGSKVTKEETDEVWMSMFASSILALSHMYALPKPDKRWETPHYVAMCNDVLIRIGRRAKELQPPPLVMACFVMRVPVSGVGIMGASVSLGLAEWTGRPIDPSAWRQTLSACRLPPQHALDRRIIEQTPSPVRIYGQGYIES